MRKSSFPETQTIAILREVGESPVAEVAKKHGISEQTIYGWRQRFGAMNADEIKRLCHPKQENARLKKQTNDKNEMLPRNNYEFY